MNSNFFRWSARVLRRAVYAASSQRLSTIPMPFIPTSARLRLATMKRRSDQIVARQNKSEQVVVVLNLFH